ncbi:MAG: hypothetical protein NT003_01660 [Candidatus Magasanikbacteria bacterium]|nr:hypothetical protein [Candidatus Magasanikbacteria bacterium]
MIIETLLFVIYAIERKNDDQERIKAMVGMIRKTSPYDPNPKSRAFGAIVQHGTFDYIAQILYLSPVLTLFFHPELAPILLWLVAASAGIQFVLSVGVRALVLKVLVPKFIAFGKWIMAERIKQAAKDNIKDTKPAPNIKDMEDWLALAQKKPLKPILSAVFSIIAIVHITATMLWLGDNYSWAKPMVAILPFVYVLLKRILGAVFKLHIDMYPESSATEPSK